MLTAPKQMRILASFKNPNPNVCGTHCGNMSMGKRVESSVVLTTSKIGQIEAKQMMMVMKWDIHLGPIQVVPV